MTPWYIPVKCGPKRPQLLIMDSRCSHETIGLLEKAMKENIIVLAFLSHTSHHLQPLDKNVFGPFSYAYDQVCSEFIAERQYHLINEVTWPRLFCQGWERGNYPENIKSGFRATGIWPHNPSAVPDSACLPFDMYDHPLIDQMEICETVDAIGCRTRHCSWFIGRGSRVVCTITI